MKTRVQIPESTRVDILGKCNNRCCVCQAPFIVFHHLDEDPSNNEEDNIGPLCPNCHGQVHSTSGMTINLTPERVRALRERWYDYCEQRRECLGFGPSPNALLKLKNFVRAAGLADHGWSKTFATIDERYKDCSREEIINSIFSTSNRDDLRTYLDTVKHMYLRILSDQSQPNILRRFIDACNAFGIDYGDLA
jgi:hypothetical protein